MPNLITAPTIVAVIVTFNSASHIGRLLDNLFTQSQVFTHVLIVDNASVDNTCQIIEMINHPTIKLYKLPKNKGGAGGFAYGLEKARLLGCDYIFTFDDDAIPVDTDFVKGMIAHHQHHQFDVLSPLVIDPKNTQKASFEYKIGKQKYTYVAEIQQEADFIEDIKLFNGVLFHKKVIEHLKGPRPEFFIRGDEQEFKTRILNAGYKVATTTHCLIYHPSSVGEYIEVKGKRYHHIDSAFKLFYSTRNRIYMLKLREDFSLRKKTVMISKELYHYTWFYLVYRKGDWLNYWLWLKAFIFGLTGYMNNDLVTNH